MAKLKSVSDLSPIDRATVEIKNGYHDAKEIAARLGLERSVVDELIKLHGKVEIKRPRGRPRKVLQQPPPPLPKPPPEPIIPRLIGMAFVLGALTAAWVGANMNWDFGYSIAGYSGGAIGLVVDFGALSFLPAARELYRQRSYLLCAAAFVAWVPFLIGSSYAALNYTGVNVGDYFQARGDSQSQREELDRKLEQAKTQRGTIKEERSAKVLENQMNLALGMVPTFNKKLSDDCKYPTLSKDVCSDYNRLKDAWTNAVSRDQLEASIADLTQKRSALPHIASKNPAAEQTAQMSDGRINAEQAQNYSIRWWAIVPGFASVMLTIGLALCSRRKDDRDQVLQR